MSKRTGKATTTTSVNEPDSSKDKLSPKNNDLLCQFEKCFFSLIQRYIWITPFTFAVLIPIQCFIPYFLTIQYKQAYPILPFLSDNGGRSPGANVFSQTLDISGITFAISAWSRYKQVKYYLTEMIPKYTKNKEVNNPEMLRWLQSLNFQTLYFTFFVLFGAITTGNFRNTEMVWSHVIGAMFLFTFYLLYNAYTIIICRQLSRCENLADIESAPTSMIVFSLLDWLSFFTFGALMPIAVRSYDSMFIYWDHDFRMFWSPEVEGYVWHVFSALAEWMAILLWSPFLFMLGKRAYAFKHWDKITF